MSFETTTESTSGAPPITFTFEGDTFRAELAGAKLYGENEGRGISWMRMTDADGVRLADITAHPRAHRTMSENVIDIGSALLWSHWRYLTTKAVT